MDTYSLLRVSNTRIVIKRRRGGSVQVHGLGSLQKPPLSCTHPTIKDGRCFFCKQAIVYSFGLSSDYILPGLNYGEEEVSLWKKRDTESLLRKRKLHLVLDLDHTMLHSRKIRNLSSTEKYLKNHVESCKNTSNLNGSLFQMNDDRLVKLRPFVPTFLEQASSLFEMYICTMGGRCYAEEAVRLLDPESKYFSSSRIIAYEDFKQKDRKHLNLVSGQETDIVILDDTESVWRDHRENLIMVSKYDYFRVKEMKDGRKSYSETWTDESENDGALANILRVLEMVHKLYFDNPVCRDIRTYLPKIRSGILGGCTLLFSDIGDFNQNSKKAEEMGATCTTIIASSVTHLVSTKIEDSLLVEQEQQFLVHPRWIGACYFLWRRLPEDDFLP